MTRFAALLLVLVASPAFAADPDWVEPMKKVHAKFTGTPGTFALFGDSITVSLGFWAPLEYAPRNLGGDLGQSLQVVKGYMKDDSWRKWRGAEYGNDGGKTIVWADEHLDEWLKKLNPEVAVLMFGTNDLNQVDDKQYEAKTWAVVERCLKNGTIVLLTTIPPRSAQVEKAKRFAEIQRKIAADLHVPLIDYQAEILKRRPNDWDGSLPKFAEYAKDGYNVPTLIAGDGVHPSNPKKYQDYSEESLSANGYQLRNVLTVKAYAEAIRFVLKPAK
jgi:lysophospholipase L1-like esterase